MRPCRYWRWRRPRAGQLQQHAVQPIEEWQLEDEPGHYILAGERKQAAHYLARMERRVIIHPVRISFDHLPQIRRKIGCILRVDRFPDSEQSDQIVGDGVFGTLGRGQFPAYRQRHLLDSGEIVFGMSKAHPKRDIRVPRTENVGHTEVIALDSRVILPSLGDQAGRIRRCRPAHPVRHDQESRGAEQYQRQRKSADLHITHQRILAQVVGQSVSPAVSLNPIANVALRTLSSGCRPSGEAARTHAAADRR